MSHPELSQGQERPQEPTYEEQAGPGRQHDLSQPLTDPYKPAGHSSQANSQTSRAESTAILDDPNACTSDHARDAHLMSGALLPPPGIKSLQQDNPDSDEPPSAPSTPPEGTWARDLYDELRRVQEEQANDETNGLPAIVARDHGREGRLFGDDQSEKGTGSKGSGGSSPEEDDDDDGLMFRMEL
ncbi:MAG: hypothetical protein OHK93_005190 [Ramalina farinacea]|uniref:Uncharacterized protein n=1 Tax=Ramalina farinacea TaxID=258253 RepID=A0AA43QVK0_9LECA|nr:hypothetical protein [Ramalina farinacea]